MSKSLRNSRLFSGVADSLIDQFAKDGVQRSFTAGQQIIREGDGLDGTLNRFVYFIDEGSVRVQRYSPNGKEITFNDLMAGAHFGELNAIDGQGFSATVTALSTSYITTLERSVFMNVLQQNGAALENLLCYLTVMIREQSERMYEYVTMNVHTRILVTVLRYVQHYADDNGYAYIKQPLTHAELASRVGCRREAVSRELKRLQDAQLIVKQGRDWLVRDLLEFQAYVAQEIEE